LKGLNKGHASGGNESQEKKGRTGGKIETATCLAKGKVGLFGGARTGQRHSVLSSPQIRNQGRRNRGKTGTKGKNKKKKNTILSERRLDARRKSKAPLKSRGTEETLGLKGDETTKGNGMGH